MEKRRENGTKKKKNGTKWYKKEEKMTWSETQEQMARIIIGDDNLQNHHERKKEEKDDMATRQIQLLLFIFAAIGSPFPLDITNRTGTGGGWLMFKNRTRKQRARAVSMRICNVGHQKVLFQNGGRIKDRPACGFSS